ncbi:UDP-2,4-diacetamido-2,4,6-trideoxy-beta-L-altropyranose hydrolase [Colwellia echini]|uniref:UDP-2,4-diacetamido-2,4, 6-trideoxy-beta-L-altropyranose hydrolase n=1 Tax=Colwellia echini TaxID=1982103 RepID=A0ABY3MWP1_9GAMM|nr:UDP-2,4-diacetamido-2,4,6-trideoxy-beta-L-altropyranose hydrolase [Colwellia echini]TYK65599.1 UDP-2,4-diacetamido-2,4,6-trideoxy-beta-L-altropyranose hydrolase [Colwellia echini]
MMFAFRVSTSVGIGHVMRMKWLALALQNKGFQSIFIFDYLADNQENSLLPFLTELNSLFFYLEKAPNDEHEDAQLSLAFITAFPSIEHVILDSYDLGYNWEQTLKNANKRVIVFDDLAREHCSDIVFDAKWVGLKTNERYQHKVPESCRTFLGPQYAILSPAYSNVKRVKNNNNLAIKKVLMSLGGGGDLQLIADIVEVLSQEMKSLPRIEISIVIGPKAENAHVIEALATRYRNIILLYQPKCLADYYLQTDLFVGALGTSLYELAATKTPAITFSIAANQQNNYCDLDDLAHHLHLPFLALEDIPSFGKLIEMALLQLPRLTLLRESATVNVDGNGVFNIVNILLCDELHTLTNSLPTNVVNTLSNDKDIIALNDSLTIRKVNDKDINHYRESRNLPNNSERMTIQSEIEPLEHYLWWFNINNQRESYVLYKSEQPLLYIWHQMFSQKSALDSKNGNCLKQYLYGGWFTAQGNVSFNIAMAALQWQLEYTRTLFPRGHWLAVINQENKFVNLLNQYMGFSQIPANSEALKITQSLFPQASTSHFNYVELDFGNSNE